MRFYFFAQKTKHYQILILKCSESCECAVIKCNIVMSHLYQKTSRRQKDGLFLSVSIDMCSSKTVVC